MEQKKDFRKWLEYLQQESWQLELIISSILLVVLSSGGDGIDDWLLEIGANIGQGASHIIIIAPVLLNITLIIAKTNLVFHIFLRGFWIGCIGLRYVSDDIDIDSLNYAPKFSNYLKKQGLNFDRYLENLEKVCSIIFSFTFLLVFSVFSIFMFFLVIVAVKIGFDYFDSPTADMIRKVINWGLGITAFLSLIDYAFLGFFKRYKISAMLFYPFYRVYNFFSFSFVYRPLYYNFIDNPFGRKYLKLVVPYIIFLMMMGDGFELGEYKFLPEKEATNWVNKNFYEDKWQDAYQKAGVVVAIPSMEIEKNFFPLYLRYHDSDNVKRALEATCPMFEGYERWSFRTEFVKGVSISFDESVDEKVKKIRADIALECLTQIFDLKIDTVSLADQEFQLYHHPELRSKGLLTYVDISGFDRGDHTLYVEQKVDYKDSVFVNKTYEIPFVKYN